jgi:hypothetical protein
LKFLFLPGLNARFYGLWRREVVLKTIAFEEYCSADVAFVARALTHGKIAEVPQRLWIRGGNGVSADSLRMLNAGARNWLDRLMPLYRFTQGLMKYRLIRESPVTVAVLIILNFYFCGWKYKSVAVHWARRILNGGIGKTADVHESRTLPTPVRSTEKAAQRVESNSMPVHSTPTSKPSRLGRIVRTLLMSGNR